MDRQTENSQQSNLQISKVVPKYYAQVCPVCNGFGTLKYGSKICQACQGSGYLIVPTGEAEKRDGRKNEARF